MLETRSDCWKRRDISAPKVRSRIVHSYVALICTVAEQIALGPARIGVETYLEALPHQQLTAECFAVLGLLPPSRFSTTIAFPFSGYEQAFWCPWYYPWGRWSCGYTTRPHSKRHRNSWRARRRQPDVLAVIDRGNKRPKLQARRTPSSSNKRQPR